MKPTQLQGLLAFAIANNFPILVKGKPGIGKSDIIEDACKEAKAKLVISHPVVSDPTDYKGLPFADKNGAHFLPFGDLKMLIDTKEPLVYFLDDLGQAPPAVQAACMQLILARRINGHMVSDKVTFIAATNRKEDKAGVSGILEPVKSRFKSIVELEVNTDDWCNWALNKGNMPIELIAFIRFRPELLDAAKPTRDIENSPSPRTVAAVGHLQNANIPAELQFETFKGAVGEGFAAEYTAFLKIFRELPSVDEILLNPEKADIPTEPATLYALSAALGSKITDVNAEAAFKYIARLTPEIGVATVKLAVTKNKSITNTRGFIKWGAENKGLFV